MLSVCYSFEINKVNPYIGSVAQYCLYAGMQLTLEDFVGEAKPSKYTSTIWVEFVFRRRALALLRGARMLTLRARGLPPSFIIESEFLTFQEEVLMVIRMRCVLHFLRIA
jgi:hypothetical protein